MVRCPDGHDPTTPIEYGRCALDQALAEAGATRTVGITTVTDAAGIPAAAGLASPVDARPESYVVAEVEGTTWVVGRDEVGAMYGALELAERLRLHGGSAVPPVATLRGTPAISLRAANLFWILPDSDQPETHWWFLDETFWRDYLDLLAHARLDLLDIHGMYSLQSTGFPNALPQIATSPSFPDVGVPSADRERNLAMLNRVIAMAHARGIRVALMTYSGGVDDYPPAKLEGDDLKTYTREATSDLVTRAPGLAMLGFRIGESGHDAAWFNDTVVSAVQQAHTDVGIYARSWGVGKSDMASLASTIGSDMVLEVKFNGEQWGPPYAIAGGVMATAWPGYSYQSYLSPPAPWQFVFQVRAGGTHRIFREFSFVRTQRTLASLGMSPRIRGFTVELPTAYTPQRDFYHADPKDQFSSWAFFRDDLMYLLWGRLGYDPTTPETTFRDIVAHEVGTDSLWPVLQAASDIVPSIIAGHTCGADQRAFAPELELGGNVAAWSQPFKPGNDGKCDLEATPFDSFAIASPAEAASDLVAGTPTSRLSPVDVAAAVLNDVQVVTEGLAAADTTAIRDNPVARDIAHESLALADLGRYFAHKLRGATALGVYQGTGIASWLAAARDETTTADNAWRTLANDTAYILPFHEQLRLGRELGYDPFHWKVEIPALDADGKSIDNVAAAVNASPPSFSGSLPDPAVWLASPSIAGPGLRDLSISPMVATAQSWTVTARFEASPSSDAKVNVLWKPFDNDSDWTSVDASPTGDGSYLATIRGNGLGALFAVEVHDAQGAWRYPDPRAATPYVSLAP